MPAFKTSLNLQEYFFESVRGALSNQHIEASPETEFYLVQLLTQFAKSEAIYRKEGQRYEDELLCSLLEKAIEADRQARIQLFKRMGDIALYIAGYFPESLSRKIVDLSYYVQMGGSAYSSVSLLVTEKPIQPLFEELANKFNRWVDILSEVSARGKLGRSEKDLLQLYDNWRSTGSRIALTLLKEKGILPHPGSEESH